MIDHAVFDSILALDVDGTVARRVVALFAAEAPVLLQRLDLAIERASASDIACAAHALKSLSLTLGARRVARCAARLEDIARRGATSSDDLWLCEITSELRIATDALEASVDIHAGRSAQQAKTMLEPCLA